MASPPTDWICTKVMGLILYAQDPSPQTLYVSLSAYSFEELWGEGVVMALLMSSGHWVHLYIWHRPPVAQHSVSDHSPTQNKVQNKLSNSK